MKRCPICGTHTDWNCQGLGGILIEGIEGNYDNCVGLVGLFLYCQNISSYAQPDFPLHHSGGGCRSLMQTAFSMKHGNE